MTYMSINTSNPENKSANPVFVLGISGATWTVIEPLLMQGKLPNFQRLIDEGCSGIIKSIRVAGDKHFRPQTAWPTLATGVIPEKHGITRYWHTASDLHVETIWDIFQRNGFRVGLYGWPVTWPPSETNGFVVPSHLARDSQTWPPELAPIKELDQRQKRLEREKGVFTRINEGCQSIAILTKYGLSASTFPSLFRLFVKYIKAASAEERALLLRYAKLELSIDFFLNLYKRYTPTFVSFNSFLVDLVSHRYWRYYEPEKFGEVDQTAINRYRAALETAYEKLDCALGRCLAVMPGNTIVTVVSEHGMSAEIPSAEVGLYRYVIQGTQLLKLININDDVIPCSVARWIAFRPRDGVEFAPDFAERIQRIVVVETGLPLFSVHKHRENEVIVKFNIPHTVPRYQEGNLEDLTISYEGKEVSFLSIARRLGRQRSAMHDGDAVFIVAGPGIRKGYQIKDSNLLDFAPTLLHAAGLEIPVTFEGRKLDIFD
ncbi:alkaline phosphatase family protein [Pseudomonadota bacterium]